MKIMVSNIRINAAKNYNKVCGTTIVSKKFSRPNKIFKIKIPVTGLQTFGSLNTYSCLNHTYSGSFKGHLPLALKLYRK